jgi:hypothetical protein
MRRRILPLVGGLTCVLALVLLRTTSTGSQTQPDGVNIGCGSHQLMSSSRNVCGALSPAPCGLPYVAWSSRNG